MQPLSVPPLQIRFGYPTISFLAGSYSTMQIAPGFSYPSLVSHSRETMYFFPFVSWNMEASKPEE